MRVLFAVVLCSAPLFSQEIKLTQVASGLVAPTDIQNAGDASGRLFLVQQNGVISILRNGTVQPQPFLDIRSKVLFDGEQGLLGLAFPPGFARSGRFYVHYDDRSGNTVLAQFHVSANPDQADPTSEIDLLNAVQPFSNHKGGQIRFGPEGFLYMGLGDGGSGGDPMGNGQNLTTVLGKLLRVDVESSPGQLLIPPGNPFAQTPGARREIWAYGLRNPWRFSFDSVTHDLWIADVGEDTYEEINLQPASSKGGENYGWNVMEGMHCFKPSSGCSMQGLTLPIFEYNHDQGCAIIGGFMYRGAAAPGLQGTYFYGDYCSGMIWGLRQQGGSWTNRLLLASGLSITAFGLDESGEPYVSNGANGTVWRINGTAQVPLITTSSAVNAASFVPGLVPGSLATIFATGIMDNPGVVSAQSIPLPASLNGVSATISGFGTPILAVANTNGQQQVNIQVPLELAGRTSATVVVSRSGNSSAPMTVPILDLQPAIYSSDGTNGIVVHNADYSLAGTSRPLVKGEYAFLYADGLGTVGNQPPTGSALLPSQFAPTRATFQVTLGGVGCPVQYAGLAPGFVGVYQVNFQVPASVPSGNQDLVVSSGATSSPAVKVPVQ